jgi:nitrate/TMAO reductase-like tetraheme cytochrome c subunit
MLAFIALGLSATAWSDEGKAAGAAKKEAAKFEYVGDAKCKICHKIQHSSWLETKHAKAYDVLSDEEKKKPECVTCHITGHDAKGELIPGVQCEACHGPGSEYKSPKIMSKKGWPAEPEKYKAMAIEAGLVYPTEATCVRCHKAEGNPNFKPFDFAKSKDKVHAKGSDPEAKE